MYILGAGITGLLLGYLTGYPVYGSVVGGQLNAEIVKKGPRILDLDLNTLKLVQELGIETEPKTFNVGYVRDNLSSVVDFATRKEAEDYYKKTRGSDYPAPISAMSGGRNHIIGWDIWEIQLIKRLLKKVTLIPATVTSFSFMENQVYLTEKFTGKPFTLNLSECISTINLIPTMSMIKESLPEIFALRQLDNGSIVKLNKHLHELELEAWDTSFIRVDIDQDNLEPVQKGYDYLYCVNPDNPINRITRISDQTYCFEFRADRFEGAVDYLESLGFVVGLTETSRFCQLTRSYGILEIGLDRPEYIDNRLKLCGRYANWDHRFKINSIFKEAEDYVSKYGK